MPLPRQDTQRTISVTRHNRAADRPLSPPVYNPFKNRTNPIQRASAVARAPQSPVLCKGWIPAPPPVYSMQRKIVPVAPQQLHALPGPPLASEILARFHQPLPLMPRPIQRKAFPGAIQRMEDDDAWRRIQETRERNLKRKATPVEDRDIFEIQQNSNYGYENKTIDYGGNKATFKKGFASQPFLIGARDYDTIVSVITVSGANQTQVAEAILCKIADKNSAFFAEVCTGKPSLEKAMIELINLTQVIEPHDSRAPGWDKVARALFASILNGRQSFKTCFNRTNGLFLPAWRKTAGAICGGQEAVRAFLDLKRKKTDKKNIDDGVITSYASELLEEIKAEMSDSSEEESD